MAAISQILGRTIADPDATLEDAGATSNHLVELMVMCDEIYGFEVPFEDLEITADLSFGDLHTRILVLRDAETKRG